MRLNETNIKRIDPPPKGYRLIRDDELTGFAIRVTDKDARAFTLNYTIDGRERRMTIGRWPAWTATAARTRAKELRQAVDRGIDPLAKKQRRRREPTFEDLAAEYVERYASRKKTGNRDAEYLRRDVLPEWGSLKAADVTRRDVIRLIEAKAEKAPISANRLLAAIRKLFNWAIERDLLETNPCVQVRAPGKETSRDRVLSADEIRAFWQGLDEAAGVGEPVKAILRLILATAQRPGEVARMERAELDGAWWTIPAEKAKNGLSHRVPLTKLAREILAAQPGGGRWVFPSTRGAAIRVNALGQAVGRMGHFGLPHFVPHDLRRTAASHMTAGGVSRLVVGRILNHAESDITAVYDRHSYDAEKFRALDLWDRRLRAILTGEKGQVVEFAR